MLFITGLVNDEIPVEKTRNAKRVFMSWRHHELHERHISGNLLNSAAFIEYYWRE